MADQIQFTLKFSQDRVTNKTRMYLDFMPPFTHELHSRTVIPHFNPKQLTEALKFVQESVIPRIVEHLRKDDLKELKGHEALWKKRQRVMSRLKQAHEEIEQLENDISANFPDHPRSKRKSKLTSARRRIKELHGTLDKPKDDFQKLDAMIRPVVADMIDNWKERQKADDELITAIGFEQMSQAKTMVYSSKSVNTDVPPPPPWP